MDQRARLTIPDVVFVVVSIAFLGALWPVFREGLEANISLLDPRTAYLLQFTLPLALLVLMTIIVVVGIRGAGT